MNPQQPPPPPIRPLRPAYPPQQQGQGQPQPPMQHIQQQQGLSDQPAPQSGPARPIRPNPQGLPQQQQQQKPQPQPQPTGPTTPQGIIPQQQPRQPMQPQSQPLMQQPTRQPQQNLPQQPPLNAQQQQMLPQQQHMQQQHQANARPGPQTQRYPNTQPSPQQTQAQIPAIMSLNQQTTQSAVQSQQQNRRPMYPNPNQPAQTAPAVPSQPTHPGQQLSQQHYATNPQNQSSQPQPHSHAHPHPPQPRRPVYPNPNPSTSTVNNQNSLNQGMQNLSLTNQNQPQNQSQSTYPTPNQQNAPAPVPMLNPAQASQYNNPAQSSNINAPIRPLPNLVPPALFSPQQLNNSNNVQQSQPPLSDDQNTQSSAAPKATASNMPRPPSIEKDPSTPRDFYYPGSNITPPFTNTDYIAIDGGCSTTRYIRPTSYGLASETTLNKKSALPLGVVLQPFQQQEEGEPGIPVVDFTTAGDGGPLRCTECRAYANPGFLFLSGGTRFRCNLCGHQDNVPQVHFSALNPSTGIRVDADYRPEFRYGSVEFIVGNQGYFLQKAKPPSYVYVVDVSAPAIISGAALVALSAIKYILENNLLPGSTSGAKVGLITFDKWLHFYDPRGSTGPTLLYVPDVLDPFIPYGESGFMESPENMVGVIDLAIQAHHVADPINALPSNESALAPALEAAKVALENKGGKIFAITASLPSIGAGKLDRRASGATTASSASSTEKTKALFKPGSPFYDELAAAMAASQISLDMFLIQTSNAYLDAATVLRIPRSTGGRCFYFQNFDKMQDSDSLARVITRAAVSVVAFEAMLRVRVSPGIEVGEYLGHFVKPQRGDDIEGPVMDSDSSIALQLNYNGKFLENFTTQTTSPYTNDVCIQCAVLFTDEMGTRRIRVHNCFLSKTEVLGDIYRKADHDATLAIMAKLASQSALFSKTPFSKIRDVLIDKCTHTLFSYRKYCTSSASAGQLILPEALKVLPVCVLGLLKSEAFRQHQTSNTIENVSDDQRAALLYSLATASPAAIAAFSYPKMYSLRQLPEYVGKPYNRPENLVAGSIEDQLVSAEYEEPIAMAPTVALSSEKLERDDILLIENGYRMVVWVGQDSDEQLRRDVLDYISFSSTQQSGVFRLRGEYPQSETSLEKVSERGKQIIAMVGRILEKRPDLTETRIVFAGEQSGLEGKLFLSMLYEDKSGNGNNNSSYVEFLRLIHRRIMDKVSSENAAKELNTWDMLHHGYY